MNLNAFLNKKIRSNNFIAFILAFIWKLWSMQAEYISMLSTV
jgi:hypothetical protein